MGQDRLAALQRLGPQAWQQALALQQPGLWLCSTPHQGAIPLQQPPSLQWRTVVNWLIMQAPVPT